MRERGRETFERSKMAIGKFVDHWDVRKNMPIIIAVRYMVNELQVFS
jgi:hypothetical protein